MTLQEQAIDLQLDLRAPRAVLGQHVRILHDLRTAATLAEALDDPRRLGRIAVYMTDCFTVVGQYACAIASGQRALALAAASGERGMQISANNYLGLVYFIQGDYRQAMDAFRCTVAALEGAQQYERSGQNVLPAVFSRTFLALCLAEVRRVCRGESRRRSRDAHCRGGQSPLEPGRMPIGVSVSSPSARGTCTRRSRCSNVPQASVRTRSSRSISPCSRRP